MNNVLKSLTKTQIDTILDDSGYLDSGIVESRFFKFSDSGKAIYWITFKNPDTHSGYDSGQVFVWVEGDKIKADF